MICVKDNELEMGGSAEELIKEWGHITFELCEKLSEAAGTDITLKNLAMAVAEMAKQ